MTIQWVTKMAKKTKVVLTPAQKEFQKVKRFVLKRFPGATTKAYDDGTYAVVDQYGFEIENPELFMPKAKTVREAWNQAKFGQWFTNMVRKSNNAFNDEKIYKKLAKEARD
jgi:hypothetical protein